MKILIAGSGEFGAQLVARLNREKQDVYVIHGHRQRKHADDDTFTVGGCTKYDFPLDDERLNFVFSSVRPDAVIFLGAVDGNFDWGMAQNASMELLAGLSNMLSLAASHEVRRFVYLSDTAVYGEGYGRQLDEDMDKHPASVRSLVLGQGEELAMGFNHLTGMRVVALRLAHVYGMPTDRFGDFATSLFRAVRNGQTDPPDDLHFSPTYLSDAIDAAYKAAITEEGHTGVYNVAGAPATLREAWRTVLSLLGVPEPVESPDPIDPLGATDPIGPIDPDAPAQAPSPAAVLTVSHDRLSEDYGYRPLVGLETGLKRMRDAYLKRVKEENKEAKLKRESGFFRAIAPFIENILVFAVIAALHYFFPEFIGSTPIDLLTLYVILVAITFGLFQASIAVILACGLVLWQGMGAGLLGLDFVTGLDTVLQMLQLFVIGVLCGHMRDRMRNNLAEKELALSDAESELETVYEINDINTRIKQTLDNRLTNYENSLARIYTLTDKLNSLQPDKVFFSAIEAVAEIMDSNDVSIHIVTGNEFRMCRLAAKSPQSGRALKKSMRLDDLGPLTASMERDEIFVNRALDSELPLMAAPIFSGRKLVSIIMLWSAKFENLTAYQVNNFLVLSKLISSIIEKAYDYSRTLTEQMRTDGVLAPDAFRSILEVHLQAEDEGIANCRILEVPVDASEVPATAAKIVPLLRTTDYLGQDESGRFFILLANTNENDAKFAIDRLEKAGVSVREVAT